jgi:hypothetical protein
VPGHGGVEADHDVGTRPVLHVRRPGGAQLTSHGMQCRAQQCVGVGAGEVRGRREDLVVGEDSLGEHTLIIEALDGAPMSPS